MKKLLIIILLLQGCAWSNTDRVLWGAYTTSLFIDTMQTREILSNDEYRELNPIMKDMSPNEATVVIALTYGGMYLLVDKVFPEYRTEIIILLGVISVACVANNFNVGVRF